MITAEYQYSVYRDCLCAFSCELRKLFVPDFNKRSHDSSSFGCNVIASGQRYFLNQAMLSQFFQQSSSFRREFLMIFDPWELYITADGGGSNGSRNRLFKSELARLADETGLELEVSYLLPGILKWNKVEHRLFC